MTGIITAGSGGFYTVQTDETVVTCRARGIFRHKGEKPLVGDRVRLLSEDGAYVIDAIERRKNEFMRPKMANLDRLFIVVACGSPEPDFTMTDKLTVISEHNRVNPVVVVNKADLGRDRADKIAEIYEKAGYEAFRVSCVGCEGNEIEKLSGYMKSLPRGTVSAFAGPSGVGKSSVMNVLLPGLGLETGKVSEKTDRGRHTTRSVTLFPESGGFVADTPGFSYLDFERFDFLAKEDLAQAFREFAPYLGKCRYTKCAHTKEEGCAVLEAVTEGRIAKTRHESYLELYEVLKTKRPWKI